MKVLQILPELNVGGVETGTVDLVRHLIAHGHRAVVVSNGGALVADLEKLGVNHYALPVHRKNIFTMVRCVKKLRQIIIGEGVDIVHARSRVPAWIAYFACRGTPASFVTTCHGYYGRHWFSRVMSWSKRVIVPSTVIGKHMIEAFGVPKENIRLIHRSVDLGKFSVPRQDDPGKSAFVIALVGRITPLKGHGYFLRAMAKVVRLMPYVKIWIIGDVPEKKEAYRQELLTLVKHLGLSDHVEFLGNRRDIPELLAQTDLLVLSTVTQEAFGRVILEAQAAGVPVVATRVGGVVEIIDDGRTGVLVPPKDVETMAREVMRVLKDRKLSENMVAAARKKLEAQFTLDRMATQTIQVYEELLSSTSILVIKLSSIGDVVLVTASLKLLREKFPRANIHCLVGKESRAVLARCPFIDGVIAYDGKGRDRGWFGFWRVAATLRSYQFDKIVDLQNNRKSHLLAFFSFPRDSYGYDGKWGRLLGHRVKDRSKPLPPVEHQKEVLKLLGIESKGRSDLELWPAKTDEAYVKEMLDAEWLGNVDNIVGINIAASEKWPTKNWPLSHIARLCDLLSSRNIRVVVTGTDKDRERARALSSLVKSKPAMLVGKTDLLQLAVLIKRCKVYVTPDSAPMHLAAAMGTPFVGLFGPTDPRRHLPPAKNFAVLKKELPCVPCYSSRCRIKTHACLLGIAPEEVAAEIKRLMEARP